jgi:ferredoxin
MKRKIIKIDENLCNGCGLCIPNCPEGAIKIIDGKARLISDLFCDGLGACLGHCPLGAITIEEREAAAYNEEIAMGNIVKAGENTIKEHLQHLKDHGETKYLKTAIDYLKTNHMWSESFNQFSPLPESAKACPSVSHFSGCPGHQAVSLKPTAEKPHSPVRMQSELQNWPVQLHLINPQASYLKDCHLLVAADCVAFACANFHQSLLQDKIVVCFCPKLDQGVESYIEKLAQIFAEQSIHSITIAHMEVPCCGGTVSIVKQALKKSGKEIPIKTIMISISGEIN